MNNAAVKKWIDALRSGEYKQCAGQLRLEDKHCVLGVLCDLHAKETSDEWKTFDGDYTYQSYTEDAPPLVEIWIGDELMKSLHSQVGIMDCNDSGMSFEQLADVIEREAKELGYE